MKNIQDNILIKYPYILCKRIIESQIITIKDIKKDIINVIAAIKNRDIDNNTLIKREGSLILSNPDSRKALTEAIEDYHKNGKWNQELLNNVHKITTQHINTALESPGLSAIEKQAICRTWYEGK